MRYDTPGSNWTLVTCDLESCFSCGVTDEKGGGAQSCAPFGHSLISFVFDITSL